MSSLYSGVPRGGVGGDTQQALAALQGAGSLVSRRATPLVRTWLHARRAEEHAAAGDARASDRDLALAYEAFNEADHPDDDLLGWSEARLAGYEGNCALSLGRWRDAVSILERALANTAARATSNRAAVLGDLAAASARQGEVDRACALLAEHIDTVRSGHLPVRRQRVMSVRRHLEPWRSDTAVRRLDELLDSSIPTARSQPDR
jgi:tetratricopeptide (TPR) repeat protein